MQNSRLEQIRQNHGLSRYRVAKDTGIHYAALTRLEDANLPTIRRDYLRTLLAYYRDLGADLQVTDLLE